MLAFDSIAAYPPAAIGPVAAVVSPPFDLLRDDTITPRIYLADIDLSASGMADIHASSEGYYNATVQYYPELKQPLSFSTRMFNTSLLTGRSSNGAGMSELHNPVDYATGVALFDDRLDAAWDNTRISIKAGAANWPIDDYYEVFAGTIESATWDEDTIGLRMRDRQALLDGPVQTMTFQGTGGLEGGADLKGKPKPIVYGEVLNIEPVLIDATALKYMVNDGPVEDVTAVYFGGLSAPTSFTKNVSEGTITLTSAPLGVVTCDVLGSNFSMWESNHLAQSETLDDTGVWKGWSSGTLTVSTGLTAPDATNTAWGLVDNDTITINQMYQTFYVSDNLHPKTFSIYIREFIQSASRKSSLHFYHYDSAGAGNGGKACVIDWTTSPPTITGTGTDYAVSDEGGGWYRIEFWIYPTTYGTAWMRVYIRPCYVQTETGMVLVWHPQVNYGAGALAYENTTTSRGATKWYIDTVADIAKRVLTDKANVTPDALNIDYASFATLNSLNSAPIGYYAGDREITTNLFIDDLLTSIGGFWGIDRNDRVFVGRVDVPAGFTIQYNDYEIVSIQRIATPLPVWHTTTAYERCWRTLSASEQAGAITDPRKEFVQQAVRLSEQIDGDVLELHPLARINDVRGYFANLADADAESARLQTLHGVQRDYYQITKRNITWREKLGMTVKVVYPRFGLSAGREFIITDISEDYANDEITIKVWG